MNIFYLREIGSGLDSGMTLQILNDYGHLSKNGHDVFVPFACNARDDYLKIEQYVKARGFSGFNARCIFHASKYLRRLVIVFNALTHLKWKSGVLVIREQKHLHLARIIRFLKQVILISEMHEDGLPSGAGKREMKAYQRFVNKLDGIVLTNDSQYNYLNRHGIGLHNHIVLPNGVDTLAFAQAAGQKEKTEKIIITYTGQFSAWKNIPLLFASLKELPPSFRLRIAGGKRNGSSAEYISRLEKKYLVQGRIDYLGFLHPEKLVQEAINGSSVLLVPLGDGIIARHATSPMKLVEYMATAIPVVAVNHPSVTCIAGTESVHLSSGDPGGFAKAIIAAASENEDLKQQRIARMNRIAQSYDHSVRAKKFHQWLSQGILRSGFASSGR